jgi:hypothetical protein
MPTPNYGFEKRKRELAKKAAKEAKRLRKENKPSGVETPAAESSSDVAEPAASAETQPS